MVLAIVDDLMFASKIRSGRGPARRHRVASRARRRPRWPLSRESAPALVILDLNNPRTDPLGTVAAMKGDPATMAIRTVGYVSHVQTEVIDAARQAGVDEVLARSAFTARLPEILASAQSEK